MPQSRAAYFPSRELRSRKFADRVVRNRRGITELSTARWLITEKGSPSLDSR